MHPSQRFDGNPILTCHDVNAVWKSPDLQVRTVHNAGIAEHGGESLMLFRSHLRDGISVLGLARSADGLHDWRVDPEPAMLPCREGDLFADGVDRARLVENEAGGVEDARISKIGDTFFVTYSAYHARMKDRVRVSLATTTDFNAFTRHGPVLETDMRNVVIFPEAIGDRFWALFRPNQAFAENQDRDHRPHRVRPLGDLRRAAVARRRGAVGVRRQDRSGRAADQDPARVARHLPRGPHHDGREPVRSRCRPARARGPRRRCGCRPSRF